MNIEISGANRTSSNNAWFRHWFDTNYYHQLYANRDQQEADRFIEALMAELVPPKQSAMLDLGCGAGRHAKKLASFGHLVEGIDLSGSSIRMARRSASFNLQFFQQDMRRPFGFQRFDYVFNLFTSFGYFNDERDNYIVLQHVHRSLRPGGRFVLDYINVDRAEALLRVSETKEIDGSSFHIERWTDDRFLYKKITIDAGSGEEPLQFTVQVAKLRLPELQKMLRTTQLEITGTYGDYSLGSFDPVHSPRLIIVASKPLFGRRRFA